MVTKKITIRTDQNRSLEKLSKEMNVTVNDVIERAIDWYLADVL